MDREAARMNGVFAICRAPVYRTNGMNCFYFIFRELLNKCLSVEFNTYSESLTLSPKKRTSDSLFSPFESKHISNYGKICKCFDSYFISVSPHIAFTTHCILLL